MATTITQVEVHDVRFPTAAAGDGSDAVNRGDYSATYAVLRTDAGVDGAGLTFTNGRGNEVTCAAVRALSHHLVGRTVESLFDDPVAFSRSLTADVQLRWLGPEKGVIAMAAGALINAAWDLRARLAGKPLWRLLAEMPADELVRSVDFGHISDALTPAEAVELLEKALPGYDDRLATLERDGFPAYTTSVGWLGYPDEKVRSLTRAAVAEGWTVRQTENEARAAEGRSEPAVRRARGGPELHPDQVEAAGRLGDALGRALGADVRVAPKGEGYRVTLAFESLDEAMALAERLGAVEHA